MRLEPSDRFFIKEHFLGIQDFLIVNRENLEIMLKGNVLDRPAEDSATDIA